VVAAFALLGFATKRREGGFDLGLGPQILRVGPC
jgi:hypothetical protein